MSELDSLRQRRLQELQEKLNSEQNEEAQLKQQITALEELVKRVMTKEALQRYSNLKIAYPDKAVQALVVISQAMQEGKVKAVTDEMLKNLLQKLTPEKKEFKIKR